MQVYINHDFSNYIYFFNLSNKSKQFCVFSIHSYYKFLATLSWYLRYIQLCAKYTYNITHIHYLFNNLTQNSRWEGIFFLLILSYHQKTIWFFRRQLLKLSYFEIKKSWNNVESISIIIIFFCVLMPVS